MLITPAFGDYYRTLAAYNAKVLEFPLNLSGLSKDGESDPPDGEAVCPMPVMLSSMDTRCCGLLLNNPHNPTGKLFTRESILPYLEQFALVVVDEAFMDFLPPHAQQSLISEIPKYRNLVVLRSLTKFYSLPGLRLGYAIAHPDYLAKWQLWRDPWPVNTLAAVAAIAALQDQEFQAQTWQWLPPARNQLFQGLAHLPGLEPENSSANFLLVKSPQSTLRLQQKLLQQQQILIRDCLSFKELGDRFFRVAVRTSSENKRLLTALNSLLNAEE